MHKEMRVSSVKQHVTISVSLPKVNKEKQNNYILVSVHNYNNLSNNFMNLTGEVKTLHERLQNYPPPLQPTQT